MEDYKDYEICRKRIQNKNRYSLFKEPLCWFVEKIAPDNSHIDECIVIRTKKSEEVIKEYYREKGYEVTGISECTRTKNQELEII